MRIVSWNLGGAFGPFIERHDEAWHFLAALEADVALIQECVPPDWACQRWSVLHLPYHHWASAIVAKPGMDIRLTKPDPDSVLGRFGSYLATAALRFGVRASLIFASVHTRAAEAPLWLTHDKDRAALARTTVGVPWHNDVAFNEYRELVGGRRFIVGGDWNTGRYVDEAGSSEPMGAEFFDRAAEAGWSEISVDERNREGRSWYGRRSTRPYQPDHVFADAATPACVRSRRIDAYPTEVLGLSDHAPLIIEVDLESLLKRTAATPEPVDV